MWADGPPHSLWWQLERAKKMLDALGTPHPKLPKYDESKRAKIPHEDEIRAFLKELQDKKVEGESDDDL